MTLSEDIPVALAKLDFVEDIIKNMNEGNLDALKEIALKYVKDSKTIIKKYS